MFSENSRILLIEDLEASRITLKLILTNLGYKNMEEANDGEIALKMITNAYATGKPFHIVFCDWNMPKLSGIDLLKKLRDDNRFIRLPFIMATAESNRSNVVEALVAGAHDYILKPFDSNVISKKLKDVMKKITNQKSLDKS